MNIKPSVQSALFALSMAAAGLVAPELEITDSFFGIELPNQTRETVYLREMFASPDYEKARAPLTVALGKTIGVVAFEAQNVVSVRAVIAERYGMNASVVGGDFRWVQMPPAQYEAALLADRVDAPARDE